MLARATLQSSRLNNLPRLDENLSRMKKSCERIAAVLGLRDTASSGVAAQFTNHAAAAEQRMRDSIADNKNPADQPNMHNPSAVRHLPTREEDG